MSDDEIRDVLRAKIGPFHETATDVAIFRAGMIAMAERCAQACEDELRRADEQEMDGVVAIACADRCRALAKEMT